MTDERTVNRDLEDASPAAKGVQRERALTRESVGSNIPAGNRDEQDRMVPLFGDDESRTLRSRWEALQVGFVDEPRRAVEQADQLVNDAVTNLSKGFSAQRERLEQQWHRDQDVSTEDLRQALRRYRSFFERLLSM